MCEETPDPFDMLFRAKWNVPRAAEALNLPKNEASWEQVKEEFREYCKSHPKTHEFTV